MDHREATAFEKKFVEPLPTKLPVIVHAVEAGDAKSRIAAIWDKLEATLPEADEEHGVPVLMPGVSEEDIAKAEERLGYALPEDFKEFFRRHNGQQWNAEDGNGFVEYPAHFKDGSVKSAHGIFQGENRAGLLPLLNMFDEYIPEEFKAYGSDGDLDKFHFVGAVIFASHYDEEQTYYYLLAGLQDKESGVLSHEVAYGSCQTDAVLNFIPLGAGALDFSEPAMTFAKPSTTRFSEWLEAYLAAMDDEDAQEIDEDQCPRWHLHRPTTAKAAV